MGNRRNIVGEFVLIVVGVFAALMLETAMSERHEEALRAEYLSRIRTDITNDKQALEYRIEFYSSVQGFSQEFLNWLRSDSPIDQRVLLAAFYAAEVWPYEVNKSTYQDLQSTGNFRLVDNIDLRTSLFKYYNKAEGAGDYWNPSEEYRKIIRGLIPSEVQTKIRETCPTTDAQDLIPTGFPPCKLSGVDLDQLTILYDALRGNTNFLNILTYRHSELGVSVRLIRQQVDFADDILAHLET
jgi:hypothetical protein